jgi:DNA-binding HxlR family transcriptional regulator
MLDRQKKARGKAPRRSPCPIACSLDVFGDRWSLLIIRDLFLGRSRFRDFIAAPESIPTNILSDRLEKLREHRIIRQIPGPDGGKHLAYALTKKGKSLGPVLVAIRDWALHWDKETRALIPPKKD